MLRLNQSRHRHYLDGKYGWLGADINTANVVRAFAKYNCIPEGYAHPVKASISRNKREGVYIGKGWSKHCHAPAAKVGPYAPRGWQARCTDYYRRGGLKR